MLTDSGFRGAGGGKITAAHLERKAFVYIRQSSQKQVRLNTESQRNQRSLVERAIALGWPRSRIEVLDRDLGRSGSTVEGRDDFKEMATEMALGHVGAVFGWEVSRLARNNADWFQLLDVASLWGTLVADVDGVYDPRQYNDRLLLGLKGTMSEAELHMLRQRLDAGRISRVRRGEYAQLLPTGLVRLPDGQVVMEPDEQVRAVIRLVFSKFDELRSAEKVTRYLRAHDVMVPRRQTGGPFAGEILWRKPASHAVLTMIKNPAYAGAFAYGRRGRDPTRRVPGRSATGLVRQPMSEWVIHQDKYPAYITWEQYMSNQQTLRENYNKATEQLSPRGVPRDGAALLQGLATCGECGHMMRVVYKPTVRYTCDGDPSKNESDKTPSEIR